MKRRGSPWQKRFASVGAIRRRGAFEVLACRDPDGASRVVVAALPEAEIAATQDALESIADAHRRIRSSHVPEIADAAPESGWVAFDCDGAVDLERILSAFDGPRVPYAQGIAMNEFLMDATEAGHFAEADLGGALSWANVLVSASGKTWLIGFGQNFAAKPGADRPYAIPGLSVAPELTQGASVSPAADVYALHAMIRTLLPFVDVLPLYGEALQGGAEGPPADVQRALVELSSVLMGPDPSSRLQTVAELRAGYRRIRSLSTRMPERDDAGLTATLSELVERIVKPAVLSLSVNADASLVRFASLAIDLTRRRPLRLLLLRLIEERSAHPGTTLDVAALSAAGWPGERLDVESGRSRVYVAISTLRKLGLEKALVRRDDGYLIDTAVTVERSS